MAEAVAEKLYQLMSRAGLDEEDDGWELLGELRSGKAPRFVTAMDNITLVHHACQHAWLDLVKCLIQEHNCNPHVKTVGGVTPLHYACGYGRFDIVRYLINGQHCNPDRCDNHHRTPLHWLCGTDRQCTLKSALKVMQFLFLAKSNVNKKAEDGDTAFLIACRNRSAEIARCCITEGHCDVTVQGKSGDTALHIVSRLKLTDDFSEFLLEQVQIDPSVKNNAGDTPLHLACEHKKLKLVQLLVRDDRCNPLKKNILGDTALHNVCRLNETYDLSKLLLEETTIDPNAKNNDGDTPLHLACRSENSKAVQLLVRDERCNPNEENSDGDTALHIACQLMFDLTGDNLKLLLEEVNIKPNAKNNDGVTPLHLACRSENFRAVQLLVRDERCNPHEKNSYGDTALHIACQLMFDQTGDNSKLLLEEANINPNAKNNDGDTPLHLACRSENFRAVQLLVRDERCNPNEKNSSGDTALHDACRLRLKGDPVISKLLLEETNINPNEKNNGGKSPLDLASDPDVIRELIRHGANPRDVYKTHGNVFGKHSSKHPLQTPVKLFMVGNPSAGKSTLTKALQKEAFGLKRIKKRIVKVSGVDEKTAGIVPHDFESKTYGRVTLYDFAGQREFYGSHAALLQNAIQTSTPIFLLVVDLSESNDDIKRTIFYWLSFLENQCTSVSSKPHYLVIGSHIDVLKSKGADPKHKASFITSLLTTTQFSNLEFTGFVAMDCQYADSAGMRELHQALKTSCESLRSQESIDFNAHCFLVYLLDKFREATALTLATIQAQIKEDLKQLEASADDVKSLVPANIHSFYTICNQLNDRGHLLVLKNSTAIENSWVIINRTTILAEVNGTIFAPEGFKQHTQLASSTGVVPLSKITEHFPKHDQYMLVGFLSHLEFCHEISDKEILGLVSQEQASTTNEASSVQGERYFFFPGLVTLEVPSTVWEPQPQFDYHCGWMLQFSVLGQFFYPRFVQVLLLRLAFSFAFAQEIWCIEEDIPALQRKCSVWKNGIYWGDIHGIETLVEIAEQNRVVVLMRCSEVKSECLQLRSLLIQKVLAAAREFCSKVSTIESFISPSDTTQYPLKPTSQLTQISIENIALVVAKGLQSPLVLDKTGKPLSLDSLLSFEPYASFGEAILHELFAEGIQRQAPISAIADCIPDKNTEIVKMIFKPSRTQLQEIMSEAYITSPVYHIMHIWRASCEGTYQCLREKLDQFSVFAGRNPLEIAGVSYESNSTLSDGNAALPPEVSTPLEYVVSPEHVDGLVAVLDDLAGSWYRVTGLLGLSEGKRRQIQLNNAGKPDLAQLCLLDALHLWVKGDEAATYEKITTVLQKHFPSRAHPLITAVRDFAESVLCDQ